MRPLLNVGLTEERIKELQRKLENRKIQMKEEEQREKENYRRGMWEEDGIEKKGRGTE